MQSIDTPRLHLRPFTEADAAALNQVNRLPDVMRYIGPIEQRVADTLAYLRQGPLADYARHGFGRHACIDKSSGKLIGFIGLKYLPELDEVDIGYRLLPDYWGKGLASEGAQALMQFGREALGLNRIIGLALPDNTGSINVLKKLGMDYEAEIEYLGEVCVQYGLTCKTAAKFEK